MKNFEHGYDKENDDLFTKWRSVLKFSTESEQAPRYPKISDSNTSNIKVFQHFECLEVSPKKLLTFQIGTVAS